MRQKRILFTAACILAAVGAMAHAPFLSSVSPEFMGLNSWTELPNIKDLYAIFEGPAYTKWRALRDSEDSRYLGLCSGTLNLAT